VSDYWTATVGSATATLTLADIVAAYERIRDQQRQPHIEVISLAEFERRFGTP